MATERLSRNEAEDVPKAERARTSRGSAGTDYAPNEVVRAGIAVGEDLEELAGAIQRERAEMQRRIRARPLVALGVAFGIGFVLGGGLAGRIGGWLLVAGVRVAGAELFRAFTTKLAA